jgi:hypothetical protein
MKKYLHVLLLAGLIAVAVVSPVYADGYITISGQPATVDEADINFAGVTLDGNTQVQSDVKPESPFLAHDPSGTGAGWHVTIAAEDFKRVGDTPGSEKTIPVGLFDMKIVEGDIAIVDGNVAPSADGGFADYAPLNPVEQTFASAAIDAGMGDFSLNPSFQLEIPSETYAGDYVSVVTLAIVTGP